jgi:hypothetical protein
VDLEALGQCTLSDPAGTTHTLADQWRDRPVLLVFLRHFG